MRQPFLLACLLLVGLLASSVSAFGQSLTLRDEGIQFPDGSLQTTAAVASTAPSYPQQCSTAVSASEEVYLTCFSAAPDDPTWSASAGVPSGYYFLVTDITLMPFTSSTSGKVTFLFYHMGNCSGGIGSSFLQFLPLKLGPDLRIWSAHYNSPILILPPGDCLRLTGFASNTADTYVRINGYLTTDPNGYRP